VAAFFWAVHNGCPLRLDSDLFEFVATQLNDLGLLRWMVDKGVDIDDDILIEVASQAVKMGNGWLVDALIENGHSIPSIAYFRTLNSFPRSEASSFYCHICSLF